MPTRIAVIAEADADRRHVCELVDRHFLDHAPDWWDDEQLEVEREYCGLAPDASFTRWRELRDLPSPKGALRRAGGYIGFSRGAPQRYDYPLGRKALVSCALAKPAVDAVILIRDMDQEPTERAASLTQARNEIPPERLAVALALPNAKREAWVLNGFDPLNDAETKVLAKLRRELGFDPRLKAERLDAMTHGAKTDAKRVLHLLTASEAERETHCWKKAEWSSLKQRGQHTGLAAFLEEIHARLVPLVVGQGDRGR